MRGRAVQAQERRHRLLHLALAKCGRETRAIAACGDELVLPLYQRQKLPRREIGIGYTQIAGVTPGAHQHAKARDKGIQPGRQNGVAQACKARTFGYCEAVHRKGLRREGARVDARGANAGARGGKSPLV